MDLALQIEKMFRILNAQNLDQVATTLSVSYSTIDFDPIEIIACALLQFTKKTSTFLIIPVATNISYIVNTNVYREGKSNPDIVDTSRRLRRYCVVIH